MIHYWINIDNSVMRRNFIDTQMNILGIDNKRVNAIKPSDFDNVLAHKRPLTCKYPGCNNCEYEFACISSHIKAMREALQNSNDDYFVIMEDDIIIPYLIDYDKLINDAPRDFDIIQLLVLYGPSVKYLYKKLFIDNNINFIKWQYLLPSAGMYIITRKGAEKLIDKFYKNNKYDFNDCEYQIVADVALYSSVNTYVTTFPSVYPNIKMGSEIHPEHLEAHEKSINDIIDVLNHMKKNRIPYTL